MNKKFFDSAKTYRLLCSDGASCTVLILHRMLSELMVEVQMVELEMKQQFAQQNNFLLDLQRDDHELGCTTDIANQVQDRQAQRTAHKSYGHSLSRGSAVEKFLK